MCSSVVCYKALILVFSIYVNDCLCLRCAWYHWIFSAYRLVVVVGGGVSVVICGGFE